MLLTVRKIHLELYFIKYFSLAKELAHRSNSGTQTIPEAKEVQTETDREMYSQAQTLNIADVRYQNAKPLPPRPKLKTDLLRNESKSGNWSEASDFQYQLGGFP